MSFFRVVYLLLVMLLPACWSETEHLQQGETAPVFTLNTLSGEKVSVPQQYPGEVLILRFWADWCPYCAPEMKSLEQIHQRYQDRGLRILAINVRQDQDTAQRFFDNLGITYSGLLDEQGEVARKYGVQGLPTTFFIDKDGLMQTRILGESSAEVVERIILPLLDIP